ncbi:MAG: Ig-like domain-containing protein [Chloroflexota bacterium]
MRNKLAFVILLGILLALGVSTGYSWWTPRLLTVSPADGAVAVPAAAKLSLTFSRTMRTEAVIASLTFDPANDGSFTWQENTLIFSPNQAWPAGTTVHVHLKAGAQAAGFPNLPLRQEASWSFRIRQPELAFLYPSDGPANIYVLNPLSGDSTALTSSSTGILDFYVNADGTAIYYSANTTAGGSDLYRLDLPVLKEEAVLPEPVTVLACPRAQCRNPVVSPGGDFLAYERTPQPASGQAQYTQVWYLPLAAADSANAQAPTVVELAGDPTHQTLSPQWSSQGLLTFYDSTAKNFVILDIHSDEVSLFPNQTGQPGSWNPNGRDYVAPEISFLDEGIAASLNLQTFANSHLILFNRLDGAQRDLTSEEALEDAVPAYSPDGVYLAFARKYLNALRWTPGRQVWLMLAGSQEAQQMTNEPDFNHFDFAWSPDGDQLAYVRFDQTALIAPPEIWLMDPFTGRAIQLIVGGYAPKWIP